MSEFDERSGGSCNGLSRGDRDEAEDLSHSRAFVHIHSRSYGEDATTKKSRVSVGMREDTRDASNTHTHTSIHIEMLTQRHAFVGRKEAAR